MDYEELFYLGAGLCVPLPIVSVSVIVEKYSMTRLGPFFVVWEGPFSTGFVDV